MLQERACQNRRHDLRRHREGVVVARELADVAALAHFNDHRQRVDVDGRPRKADERKNDEHHARDALIVRREEVAREKAHCQQHHAALNGLLSADLRGKLADRDVREDRAARRNEQAGRRAAEALPHHARNIGRPPRRHAVVADEPQRDGGEQHRKAALDLLRQLLAAVRLLLRELLLGMRGLVFLLRRGELRLVRRKVEHGDGNRHQHRHYNEKRPVVHVRKPRRLAVGIEDRGHDEIQDTADRAHEVDDRVCTRAQGLGRHVRHQRYRRRAVCAHRHEQQTQRHDEEHELAHLPGCGVAVVKHRQQVHQHHRADRAAEDEGHSAPDARARAVAQRAEERQQKQRQHVVRRHDRTGDRLVEVEGIGQDERDDVVVHLPERTNREEGKAHQHRALVVELHEESSLQPLSIFFPIVVD